jgi:hypothetical protein
MEMLKRDGDRWYAEVDPGDGTPTQKFYGGTQDEVIAELIKAQSHATKKIRSQAALIKTTKPVATQERSIEFKSREMTADERVALAHKLANPGENTEALRNVIEAEFGAPIEQIRETLQSVAKRDEKEKFVKESNAFLARYPDFLKSNQNETLILEYLTSHNMSYTADNLGLAYEDLAASNLLQLKPASPAQTVSANTQVRPRSASTGVPASGASRIPAKPAGLTAQEVYAMSSSDYKRRISSDPAFKAAVEKLFSTK